MTRYPQALPDNIRDIVDAIVREARARPGPITVRAGEKGIVFRSADGKSKTGGITTSSDGKVSLLVDVFGAVQDIRNPINANRGSITDLDNSKATKDALAVESGRITWLDQTKASQAALNVESGRITYLDQSKASQAALNVEAGRISGLDRDKASNSALAVERGRISTVDQKADSAWDRAGTARSEAQSAQSSANNAWGRAGDALTVANNAQQIASGVRSWLVQWANYPGRPPWNNLG